MAEDNIEEAETNRSSLALDSNKQREFEDKVKRIRAEVTCFSDTDMYITTEISLMVVF